MGRGQWLAAVPKFLWAYSPPQARTIPEVIPPTVAMPFLLGWDTWLAGV